MLAIKVSQPVHKAVASLCIEIPPDSGEMSQNYLVFQSLASLLAALSHSLGNGMLQPRTGTFLRWEFLMGSPPCISKLEDAMEYS